MPARSADDVRIETYSGPRDNLRRLFELAEDSAAELDSYIDAGRVLVATSDGEIIGHLQLTCTDDPRQVEIKNMAVRAARQGQGGSNTSVTVSNIPALQTETAREAIQLLALTVGARGQVNGTRATLTLP